MGIDRRRVSDAVLRHQFSQSADNFKRRRKADRYDDFRMLPDDTEEEILFFGGKDYLPLFCSLTRSAGAVKTAFY